MPTSFKLKPRLPRLWVKAASLPPTQGRSPQGSHSSYGAGSPESLAILSGSPAAHFTVGYSLLCSQKMATEDAAGRGMSQLYTPWLGLEPAVGVNKLVD